MDTLEEIIKYVDKEMSDEEMISFEQRITKDSTIRNSVNIASEVVKLLEDQKYFDFLNKLQEAQSLFQSKQPEEVDILTEKTAAEPRRFSFNWQPFAALIAGVIIVGSVWLFYNHSQPFNERLYKEYYTKYEANVQTRSSDNDNNDLIKAIEFYDHGNYTEAIAYFKKILQLDASNIAAHFFIGVSYMETKS